MDSFVSNVVHSDLGNQSSPIVRKLYTTMGSFARSLPLSGGGLCRIPIEDVAPGSPALPPCMVANKVGGGVTFLQASNFPGAPPPSLFTAPPFSQNAKDPWRPREYIREMVGIPLASSINI